MEAEFQGKSWGSGHKQEPECGGSSMPWLPPHSTAGISNARLFKKIKDRHITSGGISAYMNMQIQGCVLLKS